MKLAAALERERFLATIGREAAAATDMATILDRVLTRLSEVVRFKGGSIALIQDGTLALAAARGIVDEAAWAVRIPLGQGISGWVAANGRAYRSDDLDAERGVPPTARNVGGNSLIVSYLAVPLTAQERTVGILQIDSNERAAFNDEHQSLLEAVALQVGEAVERVHVQGQERDRERARTRVLRIEKERLAAQNEQMQETEQARDDFVSMVSHDLRTPLATIKGLIQLTEQRLRRAQATPPLDTARTLDGLAHAGDQVDRLVLLVDDLLDVSRIQGGRLQLWPAPLDLAALVRGAVERLQTTTTNHALVFTTAQADGTAWVVADPDRLQQVLDNLLSNAIKYSPSGGQVTVTLDIVPSLEITRPAQAGDDADPGLGWVRVRVQDPGIGVPEADRDALFGRFKRAANAAAYRIPGFGLGLYISRGLMEAHGGLIWLAESSDDGSTFALALPRAVHEEVPG